MTTSVNGSLGESRVQERIQASHGRKDLFSVMNPFNLMYFGKHYPQDGRKCRSPHQSLAPLAGEIPFLLQSLRT